MGFFDKDTLEATKQSVQESIEKRGSKSSFFKEGRYVVELVKSFAGKNAGKKNPKKKGQPYCVFEFKILDVIEGTDHRKDDLVVLYTEGGYIENFVIEFLSILNGGNLEGVDVDMANKVLDEEEDLFYGVPLRFDRFREHYTKDNEEKSYIPMGLSGMLTKKEVETAGYEISEAGLMFLD